MNNYKLTITYDGTTHNGWQSQGNTKNTIMNILENSIFEVIDEKVSIIGSGRTDKGVHAYGQVANFKCKTKLDIEEFRKKLNKQLPNSIACMTIEEVSDDFHSRFNAKEKIYVYKICNSGTIDPLRRNSVYFVEDKFYIQLAQKAMECFEGEKDFIGFSSTKKTKKSTVRKITSAKIVTVGDEIHLIFTGSGFLYNQVRIMAGTVIEVATKTRKLEEVDKVFESKKRADAGVTLPPVGLYLKEVRY